MEGIKRVRLVPEYFFNLQANEQKRNMAKDPLLIRAPERFDDLFEIAKEFEGSLRIGLRGNVDGVEVELKDQEGYEKVLATGKIAEIRVRKEKNVRKMKGVEPFSLVFCKCVNLRTMRFTNVLTRSQKILRSDLFSKTSRLISQGHLIYITGGRKIPDQVLIINSLTWEISQGPKLSQGRYWHSMSVIQNKIAVIGGVIGEKKSKLALNSVEVLKNGKWSTFPSLIYPRSESLCCYHSKVTFVLFGHYYKKGVGHLQKGLEKWNGTNWELICLKVPFRHRDNACAYAVDQKSFIVFGGSDVDEESLKSVVEYDVEEKKISLKDDLKKGEDFVYGQTFRIKDLIWLEGKSNEMICYRLG